MSVLAGHADDLELLKQQGRFRQLLPRSGADFSSNDYLALARSPELRSAVLEALDRGVPVGSGGSRLLSGNHEEIEHLESEASAFFNAESALFFSSGFAANATLISTLPQRSDRVFADELVHASCHEGIRLARSSSELFPHNDAEALDNALRRWRSMGATGTPWIVAESLYSMDGDQAPLVHLREVANRHSAMLVIDEAHATGVFGPEGQGLADDLRGRPNVITVHTCGKALGCEGALVCGPAVVRSFLINRGRGFIFSTAPSPLIAAAVRAALRLIRSPERRLALQSLIRHAQSRLQPLGAISSGSQILPLVIGEEAETMRTAARVQALGFDVRGIRPPTVPPGTARLRISLTLNVTEELVDGLAEAIGDALS